MGQHLVSRSLKNVITGCGSGNSVSAYLNPAPGMPTFSATYGVKILFGLLPAFFLNALFQVGAGAVYRFVQQILQPNSFARAGLKLFAVFSLYDAEGNVG